MDFSLVRIYFSFLIIPEEDEWLKKTGDPLTAGYFTGHLNKPL